MPAPYLPCWLVGHDAYSCGSIASRSLTFQVAAACTRRWPLLDPSVHRHACAVADDARARAAVPPQPAGEGWTGAGASPSRHVDDVTLATPTELRRPLAAHHHGAGLVPPGPQRVRVTPQAPHIAPPPITSRKSAVNRAASRAAQPMRARVDMLATVAVARGCRIAN